MWLARCAEACSGASRKDAIEDKLLTEAQRQHRAHWMQGQARGTGANQLLTQQHPVGLEVNDPARRALLWRCCVGKQLWYSMNNELHCSSMRKCMACQSSREFFLL